MNDFISSIVSYQQYDTAELDNKVKDTDSIENVAITKRFGCLWSAYVVCCPNKGGLVLSKFLSRNQPFNLVLEEYEVYW